MNINFSRIGVASILAFICSGSLGASPNSSRDALAPHQLEAAGKSFYREIDDTFLKLERKNAQRFHDLTEICKRHPFVGLTLPELEVMMGAAGQRGASGSGHNLNFPANSEDRDDLVGGFVLARGLISYSVFNIQFRPDAQTSGQARRIAQVVSCGVVSSSL